jgi:hypothetical protein
VVAGKETVTLTPEMLRCAFFGSALVLSAWIVATPRRFAKFWLIPTDHRLGVAVIRGFWALGLIGTLISLWEERHTLHVDESCLVAVVVAPLVTVLLVFAVEGAFRKRHPDRVD